MDLIGKKLRHSKFGQGKIISIEGDRLLADFSDGRKTFKYPKAFEDFLELEDSQAKDFIREELARLRQLEKQEEEAKEEARRLELERKKSSKRRLDPGIEKGNIAFKCNFSDGGKDQKNLGFNGVCSNEIIRNNIEVENRTWCSDRDCYCRRYLDGELSRAQLDALFHKGEFICYESQMLRDWKAFAGVVQNGKRKGQPISIKSLMKDSLCVLTTRLPEGQEEDRFIFGVFLVDESYEGDSADEGYVLAHEKYRLKLSEDEARNFLFWDYYANENSPENPRWGTGLYRYMDKLQSLRILQDLLKIKTGGESEGLAREMLEHFAKINSLDPAMEVEKTGALKINI